MDFWGLIEAEMRSTVAPLEANGEAQAGLT
jgi:hypothetical protein